MQKIIGLGRPLLLILLLLPALADECVPVEMLSVPPPAPIGARLTQQTPLPLETACAAPMNTFTSGSADASLSRPRARDLGLLIGSFKPGHWNAITDVEGVSVGHTTIWKGENIRTGVTVIVPHSGNVFQHKLPAGIAVGNGFGKLIGLTQVNELGVIETPIALTNTLSVFGVGTALIKYTLGLEGNEKVRSVNPVAGECNDGWLNDIRGFHVSEEDVFNAIETASSESVEEGSVGAGTGTRCLGFKGGIGTSSRIVEIEGRTYTVGVLVQTNYGGSLVMDGVPVGELLKERRVGGEERGSCMIVLATDAPLFSRSLKRLARRSFLGLARTGSVMSHGSGDYAIAFSTGYTIPYERSGREIDVSILLDDWLTPLFEAVVDATEEAVYNSLLKALTVTGRDGHTMGALPVKDVERILDEKGVLGKR